MDQLKLVWELEKHNGYVDEYTKNLTELENNVKLDNLANKAKDLESKTNLNKEKIRSNDKEISKLERLLKESDYTSNKIDKDLYDGSVTDMKQLEYLNKEKESVLEQIDDMELSILEKMEENDCLYNDYSNYEDKIKELRLEIIETKDLIEKEIIQLKKMIHDAEIQRNDIIINIKPNILNRYEKIRTNKSKGIVLVNNNICSGCNMRVPTFLMKDLKKAEEIIYCESCGRILYYLEDEE